MSRHIVTMIPGDGIGPELSAVMRRVVDASEAGIEWEIQEAGAGVIAGEGVPMPDRVLDSIKRNKVAIKGPITTPIGTGFRSVNVALRKDLDLYACVRPCLSMPGVKSRYQDVDLVIVRENTEDLYAGIERMVDEDTAESIKLITRGASERIARYAFEYARSEGRKKVTAVTKANIMKFSDGLFLESFRNIAKDFPEIEADEVLVDAVCMMLVQDPTGFDVMVMPNLYGDIVSDLCAGIIGGLGVAPGANIGAGVAVFEPTHGSAPKFAGLDKMNPTALILSAVLMLRHMGERAAAERILAATRAVIAEGVHVTEDLGGTAGTSAMGDAIIARIRGEV